jgi:hypothetical protein
MLLPERTKDRRDGDEPNETKSNTEKEDPKRELPYREQLLPPLERDRNESVEPKWR